MLTVLYQDDDVFVAQTRAGEFDKWGADLYGQNNMGLHVGDNPACVLANRANLLKMLDNFVKTNAIFWLNQIHSDDVVCAKPIANPPNADALWTDEVGVALSVMTADCVPIVLFDGQKIACIHAGWQGLTKGIIGKAVLQFANTPKAVVGACISGQNYQISTELAGRIVESVVGCGEVLQSEDELYQAIIRPDDDQEKCWIDIVKLTEYQLASRGIVMVGEYPQCTYKEQDLYSYRQQTHANKSATGRMAMIVVKKR